jgi:hypothetical protein
MVIFDYKPNGYGPDEHFLYLGDLTTVAKISADQRQGAPVNGWLVTSHGLWSKTLRFVFFGRGNEIFLHSVDGIFNCSSDATRITWRRFLNILVVKIHVLGALKARYVIYTPIVRILANDGMFPTEAEPLLDVLRRISDPAEHRRLAKALSAGIAFPTGS